MASFGPQTSVAIFAPCFGFGTGVFKNRIDLIASFFADLLINPGGRFKNVFQTVVFAILGKETVRELIIESRGEREEETPGVFLLQRK
jgi:hypothetical protein